MAAPPLLDGGFQNIVNFRDVAVTVNTHLNRRLLREGLLFRSARPDEATPADRDRLVGHYGVRTVVDLRSKTEHARAAEKRAADGRVPALLRSNEALAGPVQIPGVEYREVRITGGGFEKLLLSKLSWGSFLKLILLYTIGQRTAAISILGREVMSPRGLLGLASDTLDASGPEVCAALRALLTPPGPPLLVHCTQGKDRTGLVVALALLVCGAPVAAVEHDYELTDGELAAAAAAAGEADDRLAEIREMGLSDEFARTADGFVAGVQGHLEAEYGGLDGYLDRNGFGEEERRALREMLLV